MPNFDLIFTTSEIKIKNQKIGKKLIVNAFKIINSRFGESYLCCDIIHNRVFYGNSQLKSYLNKMKTDLKNDNGYYYKDDKLDVIVEFKIKSFKPDNDQVELQIIKKEKSNKDNSEILDLSDSEKEEISPCFKRTNK